MKRREFLRRGAYGAAGAALVGSAAFGAAGLAGAADGEAWSGFGTSGFDVSGFGARMAALPKLDKKMEASDTVTLGKIGIRTSRLAMGTGTNGIGASLTPDGSARCRRFVGALAEWI